jgi:hypothetical protein
LIILVWLSGSRRKTRKIFKITARLPEVLSLASEDRCRWELQLGADVSNGHAGLARARYFNELLVADPVTWPHGLVLPQ